MKTNMHPLSPSLRVCFSVFSLCARAFSYVSRGRVAPPPAASKLEPIVSDGTATTLSPLGGVSAAYLQKKVLAESKKMYMSSAVNTDASGAGNTGVASSHRQVLHLSHFGRWVPL